MRVTSPCQLTMREIVEFGVLRSKAAVEHMSSCRHCREQLASFAHGWSQMGNHAGEETDHQFADQIISRIDHRAKRRRLLRGALYALGSIAVASVAVYYSGSTIYNSALVPVWNVLVKSVAESPSIVAGIWTKLVAGFNGPFVLTLGAVAALIWFAMLDRVAGYLRLHLHRA